MERYTLTAEEALSIELVAEEVAKLFGTVEDPEFQEIATTASHRLPESVRRLMNRFRTQEPSGALLVRGFPIPNVDAVPTPAHWRNKPVPSPTAAADFAFYLMGCLLGEPIGWSTQQDGYILHDVVPIEADKDEPLGSGSSLELEWHTEDSFHPYRADYVALLCFRNPDEVATTVACIEDLQVSMERHGVLFQPSVRIRPDESHLLRNRPQNSHGHTNAEVIRRSYERILEMDRHPEPIRTFFGDPIKPYWRVDPYFAEVDAEARNAYELLCQDVSRELVRLALEPGEAVFLDNYLSVHGRESFSARYDGNDRWLKRLNVVRDLRKSRECRLGPSSRVIY